MNRLENLESRRLLAFTGLPVQIAGTGWDFGQRVAVTPDGGYIATGLFSGTVDFNPGAGQSLLTSRGDTDIYIAKYDSSSALQWVEQIGGNARSGAIKDQKKRLDIATDPQRAGDQFLNGIGSDPHGAAEYVNDLLVAADGSIFLAGDFYGQVDFNPGAGTKIFKTIDDSYSDGFLVKLDSAGAMVWADRFGDRFTDTANAVALDGSGNVFLSGLYTRNVTFGPGNPNFKLTTTGRNNAYVLKLNSAGSLLWVNGFGGDTTGEPVRNLASDLATDSAGNVYAVGNFAGTVDFDPSKTGNATLRSKGDTDGFLVKYSAAGRFRSVLQFGGPAYDALTQVSLDSSNDIIVAGYFQGKKFDADPTAAVQTLLATPKDSGSDPQFLDAFVEKLTHGGVAWVRQLAGTGTELVGDMQLDSSQNIVLGGSYYGTAKFGNGPTLTSVAGHEFKDQNDQDRKNSYDMFLWKLSPAGSTQLVVSKGAEKDEFGNGISIAPDDSILFTGRFSSTDFDATGGATVLHLVGLSDAFVVGFDANGVPLP